MMRQPLSSSSCSARGDGEDDEDDDRERASTPTTPGHTPRDPGGETGGHDPGALLALARASARASSLAEEEEDDQAEEEEKKEEEDGAGSQSVHMPRYSRVDDSSSPVATHITPV
jgi:hypothetical protein